MPVDGENDELDEGDGEQDVQNEIGQKPVADRIKQASYGKWRTGGLWLRGRNGLGAGIAVGHGNLHGRLAHEVYVFSPRRGSSTDRKIRPATSPQHSRPND